jgi:hypothetical protein
LKYIINIKSLSLFFPLVIFFAGVPFIFLIIGIIKASIPVTLSALIVTLIFSSTGKLYLYYFFWHKLDNKVNIKISNNTTSKTAIEKEGKEDNSTNPSD